MSTELKTALESATKTIEQMRSELDGIKSSDFIDAAKLQSAQEDLAQKLATEQALKTEVKSLEDRLAEIEAKSQRPGGLGAAKEVDEHKQAFLNFVRNRDDSQAKAALVEVERKATEATTQTPGAGGYAVPKVISSNIVKLVQDTSPIRSLVGSITISTPDYREIVDMGGAGYEWVGEGDTRAKTDTPDVGEITLTNGTIHAIMERTVEIVNDAVFPIDNWLTTSAAEKFAAAEGLAFVSGNGTKKPTGFLNGATSADADGTRAFGTYQHLVSGQATALATNPYDSLINLVFKTKSAYRAGAAWVMNSNVLAQHALVKDAEGQYILQRDVSEAIGSRLLGYNAVIAEDMPDVAADATPIAFGNFKRGYRIADIAGMRVIIDEITKPGFVRFIVSKRVAGGKADTQAIKFLKISA